MWKSISIAPFGRRLEIAVCDNGEFVALVFPCVRTLAGWRNAGSGDAVQVEPTHWRLWKNGPEPRRLNPSEHEMPVSVGTAAALRRSAQAVAFASETERA